MKDHHDEDLCHRLAENIMGWKLNTFESDITGKEIHMWNTGESWVYFDPCCDPRDSYKLEVKMEDMGFEYDVFRKNETYGYHYFARFCKYRYVPAKYSSIIRCVNRLHATAIAADIDLNDYVLPRIS